MHDAIGYAMLVYGLAAIELFVVASFQALRPASRHARVTWVADPLPQVKPAPRWDHAEGYDTEGYDKAA